MHVMPDISTTPVTPDEPQTGMHEASRREKLRKLQELGVDPWGHRFDDHQPIGEIRAREGEITVEPAPAEGQATAASSMARRSGRRAGSCCAGPGQADSSQHPRLDRQDPGV